MYEYGDDVSKLCVNERVVLLCNHQSTADVPVLMAILQSKGVASRKVFFCFFFHLKFFDVFLDQDISYSEIIPEFRALNSGFNP